MTVMAAEAGASAFEGEAATAASAGRTATTVSPRPRRPPRGSTFSDEAVRQRRAIAASRARAGGTSRPSRASAPAPAPAARPERSGGRGGSSRKGPLFTGPAKPGSNYHGMVLAEFVLAILLVAATPFAKKNRAGVSPYVGRDMVQLLALTVVYFLLAVLAGTGRGQARFAALFGGLILLAVGLAEAANIADAVASFLNPAPPPGQTGQGPAATTSTGGADGGILEPATGLSRGSAQQPGTGLS